jgi:D-alanine-D-alanine ligase-like ATP-grasp enzyme
MVDPHQEAVRAAALRLGVRVSVPAWRADLLCLEHGGRLVELHEGRRPSVLSAKVEALCDDKAACKARLAALGIPVPAGIVVSREAPNQVAVEAQLARGLPQVLKPVAGTHGEHVRLGTRRLEEVLAHLSNTPPEHDAMILEDEIEGRDLRIQAVGGALVAACIREPAYVVGDGRATVRTLIEARQARMRRENPANRLELDEEARALLEAQGLDERAVPEAGRRVRLRSIANVARARSPWTSRIGSTRATPSGSRGSPARSPSSSSPWTSARRRSRPIPSGWRRSSS